MKKKKKRSKDIIEKDSPKTEHAYVKFPGEQTEPVTLFSTKKMAMANPFKMYKLYKRKKGKKYNFIHTHPYDSKKDTHTNYWTALPSPADFDNFLKNKKQEYMTIAQRDLHTGEIQGYTVVKKKKKDKNKKSIFHALKDWIGFKMAPNFYLKSQIKSSLFPINSKYHRNSLREVNKNFENLLDKSNLRVRYVPAKGYELNKEKTAFVKKASGLENKVISVVAIISLGLSFTFISSGITGFSIIKTPLISTNNFAAGFFIFALGLFLINKFIKKLK